MADNKPKDNFISQARETWHSVLPSPLLRALLYGGIAYGGSRVLWNPLMDTAKSLGRPLRRFTGMSEHEWEEAIEETRANSDIKDKFPWIAAGLVFAAPYAINYKPTYGIDQLWSDHPTPVLYNGKGYRPAISDEHGNAIKSASIFDYDGYETNIDFSQHINSNDAISLFTNDPYLKNRDYTRNLGTSIIADANNKTPGRTTTLGDVFDSAADKFNAKLSWKGMLSTGVKAVVSNGLSKLFTSAIGTVVDLAPSTRQTLIDTGTWAGTISSILE